MSEQRTPDAPVMRDLSPGEVSSIESAITGILEGFPWSRSPQGHEYWIAVVENLAALIGRSASDY